MGILKKLGAAFGIGGGVSKDATAASINGRKHPRVQILPLHNVKFLLGDESARKVFDIANISFGGIGILRSDSKILPKKGELMKASLHIYNQILDAPVIIAHTGHLTIGCTFVKPSDELLFSIEKYLEVELTALHMQPTHPGLLRDEPDGRPFWYFGKNNCELFYVVKDDKLVRFHITYFSNYLEGAPRKELRFGKVVGDEVKEQMKLKGSNIIEWEKNIPDKLISVSIKLLQNVEGMDHSHAKQIIDLIRQRV